MPVNSTAELTLPEKGEPISTLLSYAAEAKPLYEMILKAMNGSGI